MLDWLFPARRRHRELMDEIASLKTMINARQSRLRTRRVGGDEDASED